MTAFAAQRATPGCEPFGVAPGGRRVERHTLVSDAGLLARVITYGGRVTELHAPDRRGAADSVLLGFDTPEPYFRDNPYFGALIGRYANRIRGGEFTLGGVEYRLATNENGNTLHGGPDGFDTAVWAAEPLGPSSLRLSLLSPDGDNGFPGNVYVSVTYTVAGGDLRIDYAASTDRPTPVNLTFHGYFNLAGAGRGDVLGHELLIAADAYTPVDNGRDLIPTGQLAPVEGTPMDFRQPQALGERIGRGAASAGGGYDHNFVLRFRPPGQLDLAARVREPQSGRVMEVLTDQPGLQLYTGNRLDGSFRGVGGAYRQFGALVMETQHFPDSVHHLNFPDTVLTPGWTFRSSTIYRFSTEQ
jgi:aldose 1-epimerase